MSNASDPLWRGTLSQELDQLRGELDRVDDALHDLLMARAEIVRKVAALRAQGKVALRPGREAQIIRRLLGRNHGALPPANVVRVWREILACSLSMQTDFAVSVVGGGLAAVAREHFGALTPVHLCPSPRAALELLRQKRVTVALLPIGDGDDTGLLPDLMDGLYVVARLPFWRERPAQTPAEAAWVVSLSPPDASGLDLSLVLAGGVLEEIEGCLAEGDPRLAALGEDARWLGAYALPVPDALSGEETA